MTLSSSIKRNILKYNFKICQAWKIILDKDPDLHKTKLLEFLEKKKRK
jgi:hypothetical protein